MSARRRRAEELLVDRATEGLPRELESELESLLESFPELDPESFELAAAAVELACVEPEPMPAALSRRLARRARAFDRRRRTSRRRPAAFDKNLYAG